MLLIFSMSSKGYNHSNYSKSTTASMLMINNISTSMKVSTAGPGSRLKHPKVGSRCADATQGRNHLCCVLRSLLILQTPRWAQLALSMQSNCVSASWELKQPPPSPRLLLCQLDQRFPYAWALDGSPNPTEIQALFHNPSFHWPRAKDRGINS